ncbi:hypothetical protein SCLCIDRAFT_1211312 [Scleroderma citrinum Foug A]|uniref:Uncharacterized protein n=1 Tax=Scleroderma citrinum Foug A TaxID=1036808 RepID=A0A0C3EDY9_9AGAM|nr:hypothetical protein SCLCIDRAFT_1211312 [Scleroderma citrinum Foug A]
MVVGQILVAMLMIIRVYAIYSQSRPILIFLLALTLIAIIVATVRVALAFLSDRLMAFRRTVG